MKRFATLSFMLVMISSGAAYANSFLNQFAGKWNVTQIISGEGQSLRETYTFELKKLKNGNYYNVNRDGRKKIGETYIYKNGTLKILSYDDGAFIGETSGTWRINNGRLFIDFTGESVYYQSISASVSVRRINKKTYAGIGTGRNDNLNYRLTTTYRRIR